MATRRIFRRRQRAVTRWLGVAGQCNNTVTNTTGTTTLTNTAELVVRNQWEQTNELEAAGPTLIRMVGDFNIVCSFTVTDAQVVDELFRIDWGIVCHDEAPGTTASDTWDPSNLTDLGRGEWLFRATRIFRLYRFAQVAAGAMESFEALTGTRDQPAFCLPLDTTVRRRLAGKAIHMVSGFAPSATLPADYEASMSIDFTGRFLLKGDV